MDKILAFSALVLLSPVFLLIIFLLKITGEGEVFFIFPWDRKKDTVERERRERDETRLSFFFG